MSQENVEIVRRAYEAFSRAGLDALLEHVHPDAEYDVTAAIGPYAGMYYGRAAIRNFLADYFESWEYVRMEPEDFIEVGEDHVVVLLRMHMRGKGSGVEVEAQHDQCVDHARRKGRADSGLQRQSRSPRSRGPLGARRAGRLLSLGCAFPVSLARPH